MCPASAYSVNARGRGTVGRQHFRLGLWLASALVLVFGLFSPIDDHHQT